MATIAASTSNKVNRTTRRPDGFASFGFGVINMAGTCGALRWPKHRQRFNRFGVDRPMSYMFGRPRSSTTLNLEHTKREHLYGNAYSTEQTRADIIVALQRFMSVT